MQYYASSCLFTFYLCQYPSINYTCPKSSSGVDYIPENYLSSQYSIYHILHTTPPLICSLQYTFVSSKSNSEYIGFSTQSWTCIDFLLACSIFIIILIQRPGDLFILLICISGPQARALAEFFSTDSFRFSNASLMSLFLLRLFF